MQSSHWSIIGFLVYNGVLGAMLLLGLLSTYEYIVAMYLELWVIGGFTLLKLLVVSLFGDPFSSDSIAASRGATILFSFILLLVFITKFGLLLLGLGVLMIFLPEEIDIQDRLTSVSPWLGWGLVLMLVSHGVTFVVSYIGQHAYRRTSLIKLLFAPYLRGIWLFFAMMGSVAFASYYKEQSLLVFTIAIVSMKILLDLVGLLLELRQQRNPSPIR